MSFSFGRSLKLIAQSAHDELHNLAGRSYDSDEARKAAIVEFLDQTRSKMLRSLLLARYVDRLQLFQQCRDLLNSLMGYVHHLVVSADSLFFVRGRMQLAQAPMYDVPAAVELLTQGSYSRFPSCVAEFGKQSLSVSHGRMSEERMNDILTELDHVLRLRLLAHPIPEGFSEVKVENGRVLLIVPSEFRVVLTVDEASPSAAWRLVEIIFLMDSDVDPGSFSIDVEANPTHSFFSRVFGHQLIEMHNYLQDQLTKQESSVALQFVHDFLHRLCSVLRLETLYRQATDDLSRKNRTTRVEHKKGHWVSIYYWPNSVASLAASQQHSICSPKQKRFKELMVRVSLESQSKSLQVKHEPALSSGATSVPVNNASELYTAVVLARSHDVVSSLLAELRQSVYWADQCTVGNAKIVVMPSGTPQLFLRIFRDRCLLLGVRKRSGDLLLEPSGAPLLSSAEWSELEVKLNEDPSKFLATIDSLRCKAMLDTLERRALQHGVSSLRNIRIVRSTSSSDQQSPATASNEDAELHIERDEHRRLFPIPGCRHVYLEVSLDRHLVPCARVLTTKTSEPSGGVRMVKVLEERHIPLSVTSSAIASARLLSASPFASSAAVSIGKRKRHMLADQIENFFDSFSSVFSRSRHIAWHLFIMGELRRKGMNPVDRGCFISFDVSNVFRHLGGEAGLASLQSDKHVWEIPVSDAMLEAHSCIAQCSQYCITDDTDSSASGTVFFGSGVQSSNSHCWVFSYPDALGEDRVSKVRDYWSVVCNDIAALNAMSKFYNEVHGATDSFRVTRVSRRSIVLHLHAKRWDLSTERGDFSVKIEWAGFDTFGASTFRVSMSDLHLHALMSPVIASKLRTAPSRPILSLVSVLMLLLHAARPLRILSNFVHHKERESLSSAEKTSSSRELSLSLTADDTAMLLVGRRYPVMVRFEEERVSVSDAPSKMLRQLICPQPPVLHFCNIVQWSPTLDSRSVMLVQHDELESVIECLFDVICALDVWTVITTRFKYEISSRLSVGAKVSIVHTSFLVGDSLTFTFKLTPEFAVLFTVEQQRESVYKLCERSFGALVALCTHFSSRYFHHAFARSFSTLLSLPLQLVDDFLLARHEAQEDHFDLPLVGVDDKLHRPLVTKSTDGSLRFKIVGSDSNCVFVTFPFSLKKNVTWLFASERERTGSVVEVVQQCSDEYRKKQKESGNSSLQSNVPTVERANFPGIVCHVLRCIRKNWQALVQEVRLQ